MLRNVLYLLSNDGIVKLRKTGAISPCTNQVRPPLSAHCRHDPSNPIPRCKGAFSQFTERASRHQMPIMSKEIVDRAVDRKQALRMTGRLKTTHLPFFLTTRLMRILGPVIPIPPRLMDRGQTQFPMGSTVAPQLIRNHYPR